MKRSNVAKYIGLFFLLTAFSINPGKSENLPNGAHPDGKILYVDTSESNKTYLATILPDGTGKTRITPVYSNIVFPKLCEASGWIGFTNKLPDMSSEVYLLNRNGTKIKKILNGASLEAFSPNGKFVLYTTCDKNAELYSYSIENRRSTKISEKLKVTGADWSSQGDWIAISALADDGTNDLWLISTMAQGIIRITKTKGVNESFPTFTKDGKNLVFITDRYGNNELEYLDLDKRSFHRPLIRGMYPALSPTNYWITYQIGEKIGISRSNGLDTKTLVEGRTPCWIK